MARERLPILEEGTRFGKWTIVAHIGYKYGKGALYSCLCDCGTKKDIEGAILRRKLTECCKRCALKEAKRGRFNGSL
jgi:hypothetical protein